MCIHLDQAVLVVFRGNNWGKGNIPLLSIENKFVLRKLMRYYVHYILLSISEGKYWDYKFVTT